jgi:hypothetical protein
MSLHCTTLILMKPMTIELLDPATINLQHHAHQGRNPCLGLAPLDNPHRSM